MYMPVLNKITTFLSNSQATYSTVGNSVWIVIDGEKMKIMK